MFPFGFAEYICVWVHINFVASTAEGLGFLAIWKIASGGHVAPETISHTALCRCRMCVLVHWWDMSMSMSVQWLVCAVSTTTAMWARNRNRWIWWRIYSLGYWRLAEDTVCQTSVFVSRLDALFFSSFYCRHVPQSRGYHRWPKIVAIRNFNYASSHDYQVPPVDLA